MSLKTVAVLLRKVWFTIRFVKKHHAGISFFLEKKKTAKWANEPNRNVKEVTLICHEGLMTLSRKPNDSPTRAS